MIKAAAERAALTERNNTSKSEKRIRTRGYQTTMGTFHTKTHTTVRRHRVVDLSGKRQLATMQLQVYDGTLGNYDFILGRDYLKHYGINLLFLDDKIEWERWLHNANTFSWLLVK
jgi:hypothetical protein